MANTPTIAQITLPSGNTYYFKDADAREAIEALQSGSYFLGVTTSNIVDGEELTPVIIKTGTSTTKSVVPVHGNQVSKDKKEYVYYKPEGAASGKWLLFGDDSDLGDLAFQDTAFLDNDHHVNVVGAGATVTVGNPSVSLSASDGTAGTGQVSVVTEIGSPTVTQPTISDGETAKATVIAWSGTGGPTSASAITSVGSTATHFKKKKVLRQVGTTGAHQVTVTHPKLDKTTVPNVTSVGAASTWGFTVSGETLQITGGNGSAPTLGTAIAVATGTISTDGTGADINSGITTTLVNIPVVESIDVVSAESQSTADPDETVDIVTGITSQAGERFVRLAEGGTVGNYAIKNQVASGGSVTINPTKKVISGSAVQGTVTFNKDQKEVLGSGTEVIIQ